MTKSRSDAVAQAKTMGVAYLTQAQSRTGCFLGQASLHKDNFADARTHYTAFFTSLITCSLVNIPAAQNIRKRAADFLGSQSGTSGAWNYWIKGSIDEQRRPYPNDLDDTALALSAMTLTDKTLVQGEPLGKLGKLLISCETAVGGPYRTWIVPNDAAVTWQDVDIAVNANIGYLLHLHDVVAPGLNEFIAKSIEDNQLTSRYYDGPLPVLYFISRWYKGPALPTLQKLLRKYCREATGYDALHLSLLICACRYAGVKIPTHLYRLVLSLQLSNGSWQAASLYYEPPIDGQKYYAGSAALTTALALEALAGLGKQRLAPLMPPVLAGTVEANSSTPKPDNLKEQYNLLLEQMAASDAAGQITKIATITATACRQNVPAAVLVSLNQASLSGWASYSLFDDLFDGDSDVNQLAIAMLALRRTLFYFNQALPSNNQFQQTVSQTLDQVDAANHWEQHQARAVKAAGRLFITELPDYRDLQQLADRSIGHCLASLGILTVIGIRADSQDQLALRSFFRHYLIARQLHDDAHDWQADLANGHLSAVVCRLLRQYFDRTLHITVELKADLPNLKVQFWETTIISVVDDIMHHVAAAKLALQACKVIVEPKVFELWLTDLQAGAQQVLTERAKAKAFMTGFEASE